MPLDPEVLPVLHKHRYLPAKVDMGEWSQAEPYFSELESRRIDSVEALRAWLDDYSEVLSAVSEAASVRYIRMTGQTDNHAFRSAYLRMVEELGPRVKVAENRVNRKFAESPYSKELPGESFGVMARRIDNSISLFKEKNVDLEKEDAKLGQRYEEVMGAMSVPYAGKQRTIIELNKFLEEQDRRVREEVWRLIQGRMAADRQRLDDIFGEMVLLRDQVATNAGFANYRDYSFRARERFDYSPEDCFRFHDAVEKHIVPIGRELNRRRAATMGIDDLRPWDLAVDAEGRAPLRPFEGAIALVGGCQEVIGKVDPEFSANFRRMTELNLFDLESRAGKAPGGYNAELSDRRLPFIFMNSVGRDQDVWTLLHESGHAFQVFEMRKNDLHYLYRGENLPAEIAEVASMGMELMAGEHLTGSMYSEAEAARSRHDHFRSIVTLLPWIATIDSYQHWVYTHPGHTFDERRTAWARTHARFSLGESWEGLEAERASFWHKQLHLFLSPFYYFEYGVAELGALGVWTRYRRDPRDAVDAYKRALALGASRPLPELFNTAGLPWGFGESIVERYAGELRKILLP